MSDQARPTHAIVFYDTPVATIHDIANGKLQAGKPVSEEDARRIFAPISEAEFSGMEFELIPENVLVHCSTHLVWYQPSQYRKMWFRLGRKRSSALVRRVPALVWFVNKKKEEVSLFALKDSKRPSSTTELHRAPFMNCYDNGGICWGGECPDLHTGTIEEVIASVDSVFFNKTSFTHTNGSQTLMVGKKPVGESKAVLRWWKSQPTKTSRFKSSCLVPLNLTISKVMEMG